MSPDIEGSATGMESTRTRLVIAFVDLVESVRLYEAHPESVMHRWRQFVADVRSKVLPELGGRLVRHVGDGMLLTFRDAPSAVNAVRDMHNRIGAFNLGAPADAAMFVRAGIHVDEVFVDPLDIFGAGVNLASRVATLAGPGESVCSIDVREDLVDGVDAEFEDLGDCHFKHVARPVRAYRLHPVSPAPELPPLLIEAPAMAPPDPDQLRAVVAVLPFSVMADTPAGSAAGDLLADELIALLSRGSQLKTISRLSTAAMRDRRLDVHEIGRRLGAHFVVSGNLRIDAQRVTATVELADSAKGLTLWADRYTGDVRDLTSADPQMVSRFASAICEALLAHELARVHLQPLPTLENYSLLLAGVSLMHRFGVEDFNRAKRCLTELIDRVPRHAEPYAWLARWHVFRVVQGWSDNVANERSLARDLCRRALDLNPTSSIALTVAGSMHIALDRDVDRARALYQDALRANPNEPLAWVLLGTSHSYKGEGEQAQRCCSQALALTPLDPIRFFYDNHSAAAAVAAGDYETGIELATRSLRANQTHHSTLRTLAIAQALGGRLEEARATVLKILAVQPELTVQTYEHASPAAPYAHGKRMAQALRAAGLPEQAQLH